MKESPEDRFKRLNSLRKSAKIVNYSCLYGVGAKKLSRESGMTVSDATRLIDAFWTLNWSIREVAKSVKTKDVSGLTWALNPVSGFWYELRYDKDRWSTINQSTGVYVFDSWLARAKQLGYQGSAQFHDETLGFSKIGERDKTTKMLNKAIEKLNQDLKLNVDIGIDTQYGPNYASVH